MDKYPYMAEIVINYGYKDINPLSTGYEKVRPGVCIGPRVRDYWVIHYVLSGFGVFEKDGVCYDVGPGEFFVIPPYVKCKYTSDAKNPWEYIWLSFTSEIELPEILSKPVIHNPELKPVFEALRNSSKYGRGKTAYLTGCIWMLLSRLYEKEKYKTDYVDKALSIIYIRYAENISVSSIADELNIDRRYLSALFTKKMGTPPGKYILNYRLTKAAELMSVHGEKPSVAASSVGISDIFYFSKIFKKHFGVSPREYIKQFKLKDTGL